ncbi:alpha/beta fold hydrolase [Roseicitreum antarcticum]|uniref:Lysophospholipase n=1 Tax=Roseicitreum antarcticum TaxID=564137 RepID=A0A1H2Y0E8_9RHOB|nr:alpha/beta hydrolase [Roseicitreum antarcticum]SDW98164.1 lysophospholipase [Roseicitreum antarcticum]
MTQRQASSTLGTASLTQAPLLDDLGPLPPGGRARWISADDGVRLRVAHWQGTRGHILILPGRTEYIEKYGHVLMYLARHGWGASVIDWRGQGLSDRLFSDRLVGHVDSFAAYQRDLDAFIAAARPFADRPFAICHSMGGCIGLRGLMRGWAPAAVAFSAPMWGLPVPGHMQLAARVLGRISPLLGGATSYAPGTGPDFGLRTMVFDSNVLTSDRAQFERLHTHLRLHPDLEIAGPSIGWTAAALREMAELARLPSPTCPAFCAVGRLEKVVSAPAIAARMARWPLGQMHHYPRAEHEIMMETTATREDFLARAMTLFTHGGGTVTANDP